MSCISDVFLSCLIEQALVVGDGLRGSPELESGRYGSCAIILAFAFGAEHAVVMNQTRSALIAHTDPSASTRLDRQPQSSALIHSLPASIAHFDRPPALFPGMFPFSNFIRLDLRLYHPARSSFFSGACPVIFSLSIHFEHQFAAVLVACSCAHRSALLSSWVLHAFGHFRRSLVSDIEAPSRHRSPLNIEREICPTQSCSSRCARLPSAGVPFHCRARADYAGVLVSYNNLRKRILGHGQQCRASTLTVRFQMADPKPQSHQFMVKALLDSWDSGRPQDQFHGPEGLPKKTLPPGRPADIFHGYQAPHGIAGNACVSLIAQMQPARL